MKFFNFPLYILRQTCNLQTSNKSRQTEKEVQCSRGINQVNTRLLYGINFSQ